MSEHRARIQWSREGADFDYASYPRAHTWTVGEQVIDASAAIEFNGDPGRVDPEAALVGALSSCHMLTFLAFASKRGFVVDAYEDDAVGYLEKNEQGRLAVTRVELRPRIRFDGREPNADELNKLHERSHGACFIANSVRTEVKIMAPDELSSGA